MSIQPSSALPPARFLSMGEASTIFGLALLANVGLWRFAGVVTGAEALFPGALPPRPYFVPQHAVLLYLAVPLTLLLSVVVTLLPAALLTLAYGAADTVAGWIARSFLAAFVLNLPAFALVRAVQGFPPDESAARLAPLLLVLLTGTILTLRTLRSQVAAPPWVSADLRRLGWFVAVPVIAAIALLPVLLWQDFNPDGLEALSMGRSLTEHVVPRLPTGFASGLSLGMVTSSYPVAWFLTWFGPTEIAARAPLLLYMPVLFLVLLGAIEEGGKRRMSAWEEVALLLGVAGFVVTLSFNNAYHPYFADIASPANLDILAVTLMAMTVYFYFADALMALVISALLTSFTRPTGVLFLGLLGIGTLVVFQLRDRRKLLLLAIAITVSVAAAAVYEKGIVPALGLQIEDPGAQIGWRLRYFSFFDFRRVAYLLVPSGVLPALALFAWPKLDRRSKALSVALLGYFAFFYVRAFVGQHHFAPIMVLPLIVLWRALILRERSERWIAAVGIATVAAIVLSLPRSFAVNRVMREVGKVTEFEPGDYFGDWRGIGEAFGAKDVLYSLFPPYWDVEDPGQELIGSPWVQVHYASQPKSPGTQATYVVRSSASPAPDGFLRVAEANGAVAYVRDSGLWSRQRYQQQRTDFASPLFELPRETLFPRLGVPAGNFSLDLRAVLGR